MTLEGSVRDGILAVDRHRWCTQWMHAGFEKDAAGSNISQQQILHCCSTLTVNVESSRPVTYQEDQSRIIVVASGAVPVIHILNAELSSVDESLNKDQDLEPGKILYQMHRRHKICSHVSMLRDVASLHPQP